MAAILCQGIGQACSGLGEILCLPCKACGMACSGLGDVCSSSFFPYIALTFGLNLPPIVLGVKAVIEGGCSGIDKWFLWNVGFCIAHCVACIYIVERIRYEPLFQTNAAASTPLPTYNKKNSLVASNTSKASSTTESIKASIFNLKGSVTKSDTQAEPGAYYVQAEPIPQKATPVKATPIQAIPTKSTKETAGNSMARIKHVLCYDVGVAIYIIVAIVWIIWQSMGLSRLIGFNYANCGGQDVAGKLMTSLICGYVYMMFVGIGFVCSLCCLRS